MSQLRSIARVVCLVVVPLVTINCRRDTQLPTAVSPQARDLEAVVPNLAALAVSTPGLSSSDASAFTPAKVRRKSRRELIAEAKESLLVVLSAEQVYFQRFGAFADVADTADIRVKLGPDLSEPSRRWAFSVRGISFTGLDAIAQGRDDAEAERLVVTLSYQRWQPLLWTVEKERRR